MKKAKWFDTKIYPVMHKGDDALERSVDTFHSFGYVIEKMTKPPRSAQEITNSGEYRDILLIPSGSVTSIEELVTSSFM